ncbi:glycosyltransferase [Desulfovibrio sp. SGI.169]|uniref:glycosyltransferase n=1 Tax=Desulfovibrio sp. SGI.169 TaxID=3420561 RepID=UPI003D00BEAE
MDVEPADRRSVHQYQLLMGIPFADASFEAVYQSHVLEHFPREQAPAFLRECFRVLRPGGILRVVVPDLEGILRGYLAALDSARAGEAGAEDRLCWMQVELLDQLTRQYSGGLMAPAWRQADEALAAFIRSRVGGELEGVKRDPQPAPLHLPELPLSMPRPDAHFQQTGERHCWMYDSVSLAALLRLAGFVNVRVTGRVTEALGDFQPDCLPDGSARKPDSLYLEAEKPQEAGPLPVRAALFSTTDRGGAGIAAMRLQEGLRRVAVSSVAYVQYKSTAKERVYVLPPAKHDAIVPYGKGGAALASLTQSAELQKQLWASYPNRPRDCEMFSSSEAASHLHAVPLLEKNDILHFHWIAGFLDIPADSGFLRGKKIVWTLHDMNPFTGGCHYADGCEGFLKQCGSCPQLGSDNRHDLSWRTWKRKEYAYRNLNITIVAPSDWLAEEARKSALLGRFPVHCIPNGVPLDVFRPYPKAELRKTLGIPLEGKALLFSADNVLNRRKGLAYLLEALNKIQHAEEAQNLTLILLGNGGEAVKNLNFPVKALGHLAHPSALAAAYAAADAVVLPTLEDNLPNVLLESLACGTPAVAFGVGGIPSILDHMETGYLAKPCDAADLAEGLLWALRPHPVRARLCRAKALERYALETNAQRYHELYKQLLS